MTSARLAIALVLASTTACATVSTSPVRDIDGHPLPTYALGDTASPIYKVHCGDGHGYLVITDLDSHLYAARFGASYRFVRLSVSDVCGRILASRS